jgi:riboflavin kinase
VGGHEDVESGVYYGWAGLSPSDAIHQSPPGSKTSYRLMQPHLFEGVNTANVGAAGDMGYVYPMVMSIGWNPFYKNSVRSVEVHIMHDFEHQFYGSHMNLAILGFIRPEYDYVSVESLIGDIKTDIDVAGQSLARPAYAELRSDPYLLDFAGKGDTAS